MVYGQGRQDKEVGNNNRESTDLEFAKSKRAVENRGKMEETGSEIICGAPTTLAVKGLMMLLLLLLLLIFLFSEPDQTRSNKQTNKQTNKQKERKKERTYKRMN